MKQFSIGLPALLLVGVLCGQAHAKTLTITSGKELKAAVKAANPGDTIAIAPGTYKVDSLRIEKAGKKASPITLACTGDKGYAVLNLTTSVCVKLKAPYWNFSGIHFKGNPAKTQAVIQIVGESGASHIRFTDCKISGSSMYAVKSSRSMEKASNDVIFDYCEAFNTGKTCLDFVAGEDWVVRRTYVHHYGQAGGVCYGIFLKGGSVNGLFEGNLVDGKSKATTVGISFGGGKTGEQWIRHEGGEPAPEHVNGIARNNNVINTTDVAYHTNESEGSKFYNNLAYNCGGGIQCQAGGSAMAVNCVLNSVHGQIKGSHNVDEVNKAWFMNPGRGDFRLTVAGVKAMSGAKALKDNPTDLFGTQRDPKNPMAGPILPDATEKAAWTDRRK